MSYSTDLTDEHWALPEPVFNAPGRRGPKHAPDLRRVVDAMLYVSHTGCQWRYLPESFRPWTRVWSLRSIRHAWRVEVAHGRLGRSRRLAKSFENTTCSATGWLQVACVATTLRHVTRMRTRRQALPAAT